MGVLHIITLKRGNKSFATLKDSSKWRDVMNTSTQKSVARPTLTVFTPARTSVGLPTRKALVLFPVGIKSTIETCFSKLLNPCSLIIGSR